VLLAKFLYKDIPYFIFERSKIAEYQFFEGIMEPCTLIFFEKAVIVDSTAK
jgi:hypothetical protein